MELWPNVIRNSNNMRCQVNLTVPKPGPDYETNDQCFCSLTHIDVSTYWRSFILDCEHEVIPVL